MAAVMVLQALQGCRIGRPPRRCASICGGRPPAGCRVDRRRVPPDDADRTGGAGWRPRPGRTGSSTRSREVIAATGVLAGKTRRALDSTVLEDAVATQDTVTQLIAAIRRVAPRRARRSGADRRACARPMTTPTPASRRSPGTTPRPRAELVDALVATRTGCSTSCPTRDAEGPAAEAVGLLALVAGQDVEPGDGLRRHRRALAHRPSGRRRPGDLHRRPRHPARAQDRAPAHRRVQGPCRGRTRHRADHRLRAAPSQRRRPTTKPPSGWSCSPRRTLAWRCWATPPTAPPMPARPGRCRAFARWSNRFRCTPSSTAGSPSTTSSSTRRAAGHLPGRAHRGDYPNTASHLRRRAVAAARYGPAAPPPRRAATSPCTSTTRSLLAARRQAETPEFQTVYRQHRPMVERSIAWIVRGNRKLRYRGITKNDWWLHHRIAAVNLRRLITLGLDHLDGAWTIPATT